MLRHKILLQIHFVPKWNTRTSGFKIYDVIFGCSNLFPTLMNFLLFLHPLFSKCDHFVLIQYSLFLMWREKDRGWTIWLWTLALAFGGFTLWLDEGSNSYHLLPIKRPFLWTLTKGLVTHSHGVFSKLAKFHSISTFSSFALSVNFL